MLSRLLIFSAIAIFLFISTSFAGMNVFVGGLVADIIPQPRLLEPCGETADISEKKELIFKWSPHKGILQSASIMISGFMRGIKLWALI